MKLLTLLFLFLSVPLLRAESFVADRHCNGVAQVLQKQLPELAIDGLFEAKRGSAEWRFAFWTKAEKTSVEEVRILVRQKSASLSDVEVIVFSIDGGLVKTKTKLQALASAEWTTKIRELLKR